ncbi:MAG: o-succinylbenzoate synthase [Acidobacteriota bacterium]|nr:o-succinylbenzoate synthase [Acidobacteriota bacterium]
MRIRRIAITHVRVPLVEPFRISSGAVAVKDAIVIELEAGGYIGYGESSPMAGSFYSSDTPESCWRELVEVVIPSILGSEAADIADWNRILDGLPAGNFTKCGIETALWDIEARKKDKPLHEMLGATRRSVESGLAVGLYENLADMLRAIERNLRDGYKRVKLKIEPGRDIEVVQAARNAFGNIPLFVDANGAYTLDHIDIFRKLDEFGLMMFEQPFPGPQLKELAKLQTLVKTPVCLDESLDTLAQVDRAIDLGSMRIANIKIQRVGGLYHAMEIYQRCTHRGIPVWMGTMPELGIGQAQAAAMAGLENCRYPTDVEASLRWFVDDIVDPLISVCDGCLDLPNAPGLGYAVPSAKLERYAIASRTYQ